MELLDKYRFLIDNLSEGVYFVDNDRKINYWNESAERITGFSKDEVVGKYCYDNILKHIDYNGKELCKNGCPLEATSKDGKVRNVDVFLHHKNGYRVPVFVRAVPILDDNLKIQGAIEIFTEKVDEVYTEKIKELERMAMTDVLTGVANRLYIDKLIKDKVNIFNVTGRKFAIAFIDIDNFKSVNDIYGHEAGDLVLKTVAKTLSHNLRGIDIIARWGGEEFIICIDNINKELMEKLLNKLRILVEKTEVHYNQKIISVTISVGGTVIQENETKEEIIKRADELMYKSKDSGRNKVTIF